jgi:hypothetical protein
VAGLLVQFCQPMIAYGCMVLIKRYRTNMMPAKGALVSDCIETVWPVFDAAVSHKV